MYVNNRQLHVEQHGPQDGLAVVLLHHGLGSTLAWRAQIDPLAQAGYRVVVYDRWGYGASAPRPDLAVPGFEDDLADLEALLQALQIERPALVGHSDGGTIALYYAAEFPAQVSALVTVAAHVYVENKMEPGIQGIKTAFEQEARFRQGLQRVHGEKFESVFQNWYHGWHQPAALQWDARPRLATITCPALVVQGREDEHASPQHAQDIAASISGSELWLVAGARHMLPQEQPEVFNPRLLAFLGHSIAA
ncbi:MAG: alpha/beta fold hydrolase [Anaerolineales bacterium]|nr:alpha/beta fold hydrolase [Anaerolineales bacterium]